MSALRVMLVMLVGTLLAACHVGPQIDESNSDLGRQPHGAHVFVELTRLVKGPRVEYEGELLEVRDDGLVVITQEDGQSGSQMLLVPWTRVFGANATELKGVNFRSSYGRKKRGESIEMLRNVSRFPQGLSAELTGQLLAYYGQTALGALD